MTSKIIINNKLANLLKKGIFPLYDSIYVV